MEPRPKSELPSLTVSSYRWVPVGLWMFSSVSGFMIVSTIGLMMPAISVDLKLSPSQQGILASAAFWGNLTLALPLSWWTSRYGPRMLTAVTLMLATIFIFIQGWAPVFVVLLIGRVGFGIAVIAREPARALLTQQWFLPREFVLVNGVSNLAYGLVVGGGLVGTPFLLAALGDDWRTTLNIFGAFYAVLLALWIVLGKERPNSDAERTQVPRDTNIIRSVLAYRDLWIVGIGYVGTTLASSAYLVFFPTLMLEEYNVALQWSGAILALSTFVGGVAGFGIGYLVMIRGHAKVFLGVLGILMAATYVGMTLTESIPLLLALSFVNGIAWGFWPLLYTVPFHLPGIRPRQVAVSLAFVMSTISLGIVSGPLIVGFLQEGMGSLKVALMIVSIAPVSLTVAGILLRTSYGGVAPGYGETRTVAT